MSQTTIITCELYDTEKATVSMLSFSLINVLLAS